MSPPLTDLGRQQAEQAAQKLTDQSVTHIRTSPAVRAMETAEIIGRHLGLGVTVDPLLIEKGLDEEMGSVLERIHQFISEKPATGTVAVSHGDTIALAVGMQTGQRPELPANGSVSATHRRPRPPCS